MVRMALKFASNLSFMFPECPNFLARYQLAKEAGFKYVESGFPLGCSIEDVVDAKNKANVDQVLINVFTGDVTKRELGFAAIPGKEKDFKESVELTIRYAKALNCKMIHVMSGIVDSPNSDNDRVYEENLKWAVKKFSEEEIIGLIEPINNITVPQYYMHNFAKGLNFVKKLNSPNLKLLLDVFHLQHSCGNITHTIVENLLHIGHVQVAQVPYRQEPDSSGEVNYKYVLSLLEKEDYTGYIGLEYKPRTTARDGINWIRDFGYKL